MKTLIGSTGIIGSAFNKRWNAEVAINSQNIESLRGKSFEHIVCVAPYGRTQADSNPEQDQQGVNQLIDVLHEVKAYRFTLISCGCVFPKPGSYSEDDQIVSCDEMSSYAKERMRLEEFVESKFGRVLTVRLPEFFAPGVVPPILNSLHEGKLFPCNQLVQLYPLYRLYEDVMTAWSLGLSKIHLATEQLTIEEIVSHLFHQIELNDLPVFNGNFQEHISLLVSKYDVNWNNSHGFLWSKQEILDDLAAFCARMGW